MNALMEFFSNPEIWSQIAMLILAGAVSGIFAGLLGVGGGAIMVPVLYEFFGLMGVDDSVRTHLAIGTSLCVIIPTSIRSFLSHKNRGAVDMNILKIWFFPIIIGSLIGAITMFYLSGVKLRLIFGIFTFLIGIKLFLNFDKFKLGNDIPSKIIMVGYGLSIGFISKLMGIGGGIIGNTILTLYNRPLHQAIATCSGLGFIIAVPGVIGDMIAGWPKMDILPIGSVGYVSIIGACLLIPSSVFCAPLGVKIAHALPKRYLEIAFSIFLFSVSFRFLSSVL